MDWENEERGSVLMTTLLFFLLVFMMVGGWMSSWLAHEQTLQMQQEHVQSVYLLDSGILWARMMLENDAQWPGGSMETPGGRILATVSREVGGMRELYVRGETDGGTATVKVWLDADGRMVLRQEVGDVLQ